MTQNPGDRLGELGDRLADPLGDRPGDPLGHGLGELVPRFEHPST